MVILSTAYCLLTVQPVPLFGICSRGQAICLWFGAFKTAKRMRAISLASIMAYSSQTLGGWQDINLITPRDTAIMPFTGWAMITLQRVLKLYQTVRRTLPEKARWRDWHIVKANLTKMLVT